MFQDLDQDGIRDPGESGVPDRTVSLDIGDDGTPDASVQTDPDGRFQFKEITAVTFRVTADFPPKWKPTTESAFVFSPSGPTDFIDVDFGGFPDDDLDGVGDPIEDGSPNGGDGNGDGFLDSEQANVASLPNSANDLYITLVGEEGAQLVDVAATENPSPSDAPESVDFQIGFVEYRLTGIEPGAATTVVLLLPEGVATNSFFKYGPTAKTPPNITRSESKSHSSSSSSKAGG